MSYQIGGYAFMTDPSILPSYIGALQASINALSASGTPQEQISQLCQEFMNNPQPALTCPATSIEDETMAALYTEVNFKLNDPDYLYKLEQSSDDHEKTSHTQLSQWADIATQKMLRSPYLLHHNSGHKSRFVIDAILLDRLDQLDNAVSERLTWFYDVQLAVWSGLKREWIQGKAANCLMYGKQKNDMHTALLVLEAKELGTTTDITQLITYLAAVQDARKKTGKLDVSVFGISTDAYGWQFLFLNSDRKLSVSPAINWYFQSSLVIQWIDRILQDAIRIIS